MPIIKKDVQIVANNDYAVDEAALQISTVFPSKFAIMVIGVEGAEALVGFQSDAS